jgi:hypothetical protein
MNGSSSPSPSGKDGRQIRQLQIKRSCNVFNGDCFTAGCQRRGDVQEEKQAVLPSRYLLAAFVLFDLPEAAFEFADHPTNLVEHPLVGNETGQPMEMLDFGT